MKKIATVVMILLLASTCIFALAEGDKANSTETLLTFPVKEGENHNGFVFGGQSVQLIDSDVVDGEAVLTLKALQPGDSLVVFRSVSSKDSFTTDQHVILVTVLEDMTVATRDVTEVGVYTGTVVSVDEAEHAATLMTDRMGEVIAYFPQDMALPGIDLTITVYTNGIATMSLPAIINVMTWQISPSLMTEANG